MTRVTAREIGELGESLAAAWLTAHGYQILERNYYAAHHEIDIIARNDTYLCFVEVKTRRVSEAARFGRPAAAVGRGKQQRLIYAAEQYLRRHKPAGQPRMDVIEVYLPDGIALPEQAERIVHMPGAYRRR